MADRARDKHIIRRALKRWSTLALLLLVGTTVATDVASDAQSSRPVIRVGDSTITVGQLQARMAQVPAFQLRTMGKTPDELRQSFAEQMVAMELMVQGARDAELDQRSDVNDRIRAVLRSALLADMRREASAEDVTMEDIRRFYEANKAQYQSPLRIKIWQILVNKKEEAEAILEFIKNDEEYNKEPLPGWEKLAREKSIDKSTSMRRGHVGFVEPDGSTAQRSVKVDPALYKAALTVKDGEVVPTPVQVAAGWAVVQRRGSHGPMKRTLEMEAMTIRNKLAKDKMQDKANKLLASLRAKHVREQHDRHVDKLEMTPEGELGSKKRPGTLSRESRPARGKGRPQGHPGHMH